MRSWRDVQPSGTASSGDIERRHDVYNEAPFLMSQSADHTDEYVYGINSDLILGSRRKPSTDRGRDESSSFGRYELKYMWNGSTCRGHCQHNKSGNCVTKTHTPFRALA